MSSGVGDGDGLGHYKPPERLVILGKAWPEAYGHIVWLINLCLKVRWLMPREKHRGCSGEIPDATATVQEEKTNCKGGTQDGICGR